LASGVRPVFVLFLCQYGVEHAVPLALQSRIEIRGLASRLDDLEVQRRACEKFPVLRPRVEAGTGSGIEWGQSDDVDLCQEGRAGARVCFECNNRFLPQWAYGLVLNKGNVTKKTKLLLHALGAIV
jgi:hypothetical protein